MNASCEIIRDLLPLYVDGALSDASAALVREHLRECHPCRLNYRQLKPVVKPCQAHVPDSHAEYGEFVRRIRSRRITIQAAVAASMATMATLAIVAWAKRR